MSRYSDDLEKSFKVLTSDEMKEIDRITIHEFGIPGAVLMENAGVGCVEELEKYAGRSAGCGRRVEIFCGIGNNGGDGFVIGRHLANRGWNISLYLLGKKKQLKGDALLNANAFLNFGNKIISISGDNFADYDIGECDLIVDAIFGNGIRGAIRGLALKVIERINDLNIPVLSVDFPSGLPTDNTLLEGVAINASITCTMGLPKISQLLYPTKKHVGELVVLDIGFPATLLESEDLKVQMITKQIVQRNFPEREEDVHKGNCGSVGVIAGARGMTGAAALSCHSSFLTGAGYVKLACPSGINDVMEKKLTETITYPMQETDEISLSLKACDRILDMVGEVDAVTIGPGLSRVPETQKLVIKLIENIESPMVMDADGLFALQGNVSILGKKKNEIVLTPHIGEMVHLSGKKKEEIIADPVGTAREFAIRYKVCLVLKSASTVIASSDGRVAINTTGNDGMATAGSGDVLSGVISTLLAQGVKAFEAAYIGVWLHGMAGDLANIKYGKRALLASDIMGFVPDAIRKIVL